MTAIGEIATKSATGIATSAADPTPIHAASVAVTGTTASARAGQATTESVRGARTTKMKDRAGRAIRVVAPRWRNAGDPTRIRSA
jgi:hypothetical protein